MEDKTDAMLSQDDIDALLHGDAGAPAAPEGGEESSEQDMMAAQWAEALENGEDIAEGQPLGQSSTPVVEQPQFAPLGASAPPGEAQELDFILDIPLEVTVEIGRTRMLIHDLLRLGQGSVIELNRLAGEPLDILVNQKLVARGEVVVVSEKFGIRITDIVSPLERVKRLG